MKDIYISAVKIICVVFTSARYCIYSNKFNLLTRILFGFLLWNMQPILLLFLHSVQTIILSIIFSAIIDKSIKNKLLYKYKLLEIVHSNAFISNAFILNVIKIIKK